MLYCTYCTDAFDLNKTGFMLFCSKCDICGRPIASCYFTMEEDEIRKLVSEKEEKT